MLEDYDIVDFTIRYDGFKIEQKDKDWNQC